ncbi:MAG: hypothetical protein WC551_11460 [Patescibacteria group bacterium]
MPTPVKYDATPGGPGNHYKGLGWAAKQGKWPTASARDWRSGKASEETREKNSRPLSEMAAPAGSLNPAWVEWLMGWPIGWTSLEPLPEAITLGWKVDSADMEAVKEIGIPTRAMNVRSERFRGSGKAPNPGELAKFHDGGSGPIPRVATGVKDRVARLKAIGNGQVPQCMAAAWRVLQRTGS